MADKLLVTAIEGLHMLSMGRSTFWRAVSAGMLPPEARPSGACISSVPQLGSGICAIPGRCSTTRRIV